MNYPTIMRLASILTNQDNPIANPVPGMELFSRVEIIMVVIMLAILIGGIFYLRNCNQLGKGTTTAGPGKTTARELKNLASANFEIFCGHWLETTTKLPTQKPEKGQGSGASGGIDLIAGANTPDEIICQCKNGITPIGVGEIRTLIRSAPRHRHRVFFSGSGFTPEAEELGGKENIRMVDAVDLAKTFNDFPSGVRARIQSSVRSRTQLQSHCKTDINRKTVPN